MGKIFGKSIHVRNFDYDVSQYRLSGWRWGGRKPSGTRVFGQFSLAENRVAELHLATRVFLAGNHISDEQRDKVQEGAREKNLKNLSEESLERRRRTP